jgi:general secretion pathway protein E
MNAEVEEVSINLPFGYARRKGVLVTGTEDGQLLVAVRAPGNSTALAELRRRLGLPLRLSILDAGQFDALLQARFQQGEEVLVPAAVPGEEQGLAQVAAEMPEPDDLLDSDDDAPIIRLINALLTQAVREGASDIHLEPFENRLSVRFRVDGVMREVIAPQRSMAPLLASRVKVMARLDIAEKRLPQDGRISIRIAGRPVDIRVSTLPSGHGERVVMRLLDKQAGRLELPQLGMLPGMLERLDSLIHRPHGIILVTGPTGSGKTTTLYAALQCLNDRSRNIMTVEDPIEYHIDGIGQTQVNSQVDLSFALGLRAILRQDPDVVMVGEIRDVETAQIAVQASLTGHLVLSTLHTNTAVGSIARLRDMGVEPFLLSSSLIGVIAQRLVRVLDPLVRESYVATETEFAAAGRPFEQGVKLYRPRHDRPQDNSGYRGRTGIYELLEIDDTLRQLIHDGAAEQAMAKAAGPNHAAIVDDGWAKAIAGSTSLEEILRVTREH